MFDQGLQKLQDKIIYKTTFLSIHIENKGILKK